MNAMYAAILLLSATGHAERSMVVEDQQMAGVFARVIGGALGDATGFERRVLGRLLASER